MCTLIFTDVEYPRAVPAVTKILTSSLTGKSAIPGEQDPPLACCGCALNGS